MTWPPYPSRQPSQEPISPCKSKRKIVKRKKKWKNENLAKGTNGTSENRKWRKTKNEGKKWKEKRGETNIMKKKKLSPPLMPHAATTPHSATSSRCIPKRETATPSPPPSPRPRETHLDSCHRLLNLPSLASLLQLNSQVFNLSFPSFHQNLI